MNYEWAEVYVSDFGLARAQEADGQVATTKQNFGPLAVRDHPVLYHLAIHEIAKGLAIRTVDGPGGSEVP